MPDRPLTPVSVTAVRVGRTNIGVARIVFDEDTLSVLVSSMPDDHAVRVGFDSVESVVVAGDELVLALHDGSRVTFVCEDAAQFRGAVLTRCRALPEVTRALRTLGSRRGTRSRRDSSPTEQKQFFAPLLEARRAAGAASAPAAAISAFDAVALGEALNASLREFAASRHAEEGPARRALEAELEEIVEPLLAAMAMLDDVAAGARGSVDDLALWRAWASQLRSTFEVADRVWISLDAALDIVPLAR